jgi:hypothetical protein
MVNTEVWIAELISNERFLEVLPSGMTTAEAKRIINRRWPQSPIVSSCHKTGFTQQEILSENLYHGGN